MIPSLITIMSSMDIMSFTTTAIAIAVFFHLIFPPLLNCIFLTSLILTIAATITRKTKPALEISVGAPITPPRYSIGAAPSTPQIPTKQNRSFFGNGVRYLRMISSGGGGSLYVVEIKPSDDQKPARLYAGKVMDKSSVAAKTELQILKTLDHPFLPKLHAVLNSPTNICLLTELCPAGDLNRLLQDQPLERFSDSAVRFYAAEVLLALEYLHMKGIVHRDIKPENILIRRDGHIMLIDFDLSLKCNDVVSTLLTSTNRKPAGKFIQSWFRKPKKNKPEFVAEPVNAWSKSFVGTYEYMAPEMVFRRGHGSAVDWWALGILMYEMLYSTTPFLGPDNERTMANVCVRALQFPPQPAVSREAKDLIERLLVKEPADRLGSTTGAPAIKSHPFFREVNWALVRNTAPPFVPHSSVNNYCYESDCSSFAPRKTSSSKTSSNTSISRCWSANSSTQL